MKFYKYISGADDLKCTVTQMFRMRKDIVAIKVNLDEFKAKEAGIITPYVLISRYDDYDDGLNVHSDEFFKDDTVTVELIGQDGAVHIGYMYESVVKRTGDVTDCIPIKNVELLKKADLSSEDLYYVFNRSSSMPTVFDDTDAFQRFYGLKPEEDAPAAFIDDDKMQMKISHIQEEFDELKRAYAAGDLAEAADAIIDLIYVASGLMNLLNLPANALWRDVQNSNMIGKERVKSLDEATKRGTTFDVRKTKDWIGPRGKEIIDEYNKRFA